MITLQPMKWMKLPFESKLQEFERVCTAISRNQPKTAWDENIAKLKKLYLISRVILLKDSTWNLIDNTDSKLKLNIYQIKRYVEPTTLFPVINSILSRSAQAPVVLTYKNSSTLIAGENELIACRFLDIRPGAVVLNWK